MNTWNFGHIHNIGFILLLLICLALLILGYQKKSRILQLLHLKHNFRRQLLESLLLLSGMLVVLLALLGPQVLQGYTKVQKKGLDIYVLIDTSKSMLVEDIKPNRITRAKKVIETILSGLDGDRIGFIPFTSSAYIQMPLTDDYEMAKMYLDVMDTDMISGSGTNIPSALQLAEDSFEQNSSADRVVIILSDGEEHDTAHLDELKNMKLDDIYVYPIGIGTEKGGLIPIYGTDGSQVSDYMKDNNGEYVTSKLAPDILHLLASAGKGMYLQSSEKGDEIVKLTEQIATLKKDILKMDRIDNYAQLYQYFLGAGILLITTSCLLPRRRVL